MGVIESHLGIQPVISQVGLVQYNYKDYKTFVHWREYKPTDLDTYQILCNNKPAPI